MDRQTLVNYGWIVIASLVLAVMLTLATPFGKYVMDGVSSVASGYINVSNEAMSDTNRQELVTEWEDKWLDSAGNDENNENAHTNPLIVTGIKLVNDKYTHNGYVYTAVYENEWMAETIEQSKENYKQYVEWNCCGSFENHLEWCCDGISEEELWEQLNLTEETFVQPAPIGWTISVEDKTQERYNDDILMSINGAAITNLNNTFYECTNLKDASNIKIPDTVTSMNYTFYKCSSLKDDSMPTIPNSVTSMTYTFAYCSSLVDISDFKLPNNIEVLNDTFRGCSSLVSTGLPQIPDSVIRMSGTFSYCTSITNLDNFSVPDGIKELHQTFVHCTGLTDINGFVIPETVTYTRNLFYGCYNITNLNGFAIPLNVTNTEAIFRDCTKLSGTIIVNANPTAYVNMFSRVNMSNITLSGSCSASLKQLLANTGTNGSSVTITN